MTRLTQERLKQVLHYNSRTGVWTWKVVLNNRITIGSVAGYIKKYRVIGIDGHQYYSAPLAWFYMTGVWPEFEIDHEDTDPSNDRWKNLREATDSQQAANKKKSKINTSGFKGVRFRHDHFGPRPWRASIKVHGKRIHLGCTSTPEAAHKLYVTAAKKHFGKFARAT